MGYKQRLNQAKQKVRNLAKEYYDLLKKEEIDWEEMKEMLHDELLELKHQVYGESAENRDRNEGQGNYGHDERVDIYLELKNLFHKELKKFPKLEQKEESVEEEANKSNGNRRVHYKARDVHLQGMWLQAC